MKGELLSIPMDTINKRKEFKDFAEYHKINLDSVTRMYYRLQKEIVKDEVVPSLIPETNTPTWLSQVEVPMYKAELDGSIHEKAQDVVKANVRAIIDSIPSVDADDKAVHSWFFENQNKVNYLLNTDPSELWN